MGINSVIEIIDDNLYIYEILKNCPYQILKTMEVICCKPGQFLFYQGHCNNNFYIIVSGKIETYTISETGKKYSTIFGNEKVFLGEFEIFEGCTAKSYVKALTDLKLIKIKRKNFIKWLEIDNNFSCFFAKHTCLKYANYTLKTCNNYFLSLKDRLCEYLIFLAKQKNMTTNLEIKLDKKFLSKEFSVTVRSINRVLQFLSENQIIEINKNIIKIKDIKILHKSISKKVSRRETLWQKKV